MNFSKKGEMPRRERPRRRKEARHDTEDTEETGRTQRKGGGTTDKHGWGERRFQISNLKERPGAATRKAQRRNEARYDTEDTEETGERRGKAEEPQINADEEKGDLKFQKALLTSSDFDGFEERSLDCASRRENRKRPIFAEKSVGTLRSG
ncbi:MAG TPA: hypothetical protein VMH00_17505 [Candidatus Limnocylindrales bacterium]|nr:hypothetical protein [Candidatus Limnocylindrales bacterium]